MDSDEDDEQGPYTPSAPTVEDEAQVFDGLRAQFPLSFGRQEPKKASLEAIHSATKRSDVQNQQAKKGTLQDRFLTAGSYFHKSSLHHESEKLLKPIQGPLPMGSSEPLRRLETFTAPAQPSLASDEDDIMVGPPLPPNASLDDGDGEDIGPPRPCAGDNLSSTDDEDGDTDGDNEVEDEDFHHVPISHEIVLKGHTKVWNVKAGWGSRPDVYIEKAHADGEDVTGLKFVSDGYTLISRSLDETLKVWDLRATKAAVKVFSNLPNLYQQTNVALSPDEQLILTGSSVEKGGSAGGILYLFDKRSLELVRKIGVSSSSVICCVWHKRLNQILATSGDKKEGGTHILYDPAVSERGALVCVARAPRKKSADDFEAPPVIHHPHALPLFRDEPSRKRQREKARSDPVKSKRPDLPVTGPGFGGRVGTTKGSLLTQYLLKEGGLIKETWMDEDPREAILKYADVAAKDPKYIAPAYAETQPKTILAASDSEDEEK